MTPEVRVHEDVATLIGDAASWFVARLEAVAAGGRDPHVCLTGGSLAEPFHGEVARRMPDADLDPRRIHWWWGDERFAPAGSPERNDVLADDMLAALGAPADRVHRVPGPDAVATVEDAARAYGGELRASDAGRFDVVVLGMGPDGHVASLFPGHASLTVDDAVALAETDSPKPPPERVSLTLGALNRTAAVQFLVAGQEKAPALAAALAPGPVGQCPARGVAGQEETVWFVDSPASSLA